MKYSESERLLVPIIKDNIILIDESSNSIRSKYTVEEKKVSKNP